MKLYMWDDATNRAVFAVAETVEQARAVAAARISIPLQKQDIEAFISAQPDEVLDLPPAYDVLYPDRYPDL